MKKYIITNAMNVGFEGGGGLDSRSVGGDDMQVSDGYHTMDELYEHRIELFITLCRLCEKNKQYWEGPTLPHPWRSKKHSDNTVFDGWFILGIGYEKGEQMSYHLPIQRWDDTNFVLDTLENAPEWDGHTSDDVLERLKKL
jgi:hypothetical protein